MAVHQVERLTVDVMVFRDYLDERKDYAHALKLIQLHRAGEVELAAAFSGYLIDTTKLPGDLWQRMRTLFAEERIADTAQLAYPGVMVPGENLFPGAGVDGLADAWNAVLDDWRTHEGRKPEAADRLHVETHLLEGRDVFITNERGLLAMCRRLGEHGFTVKAMSVSNYLQSRCAPQLCPSQPQ
jgi:hypothetical protein